MQCPNKNQTVCWRCHVWLNTSENDLLQTCRTRDKSVLGWNSEINWLYTVFLPKYISRFQTKCFKGLLVPHPGSGQEELLKHKQPHWNMELFRCMSNLNQHSLPQKSLAWTFRSYPRNPLTRQLRQNLTFLTFFLWKGKSSQAFSHSLSKPIFAVHQKPGKGI